MSGMHAYTPMAPMDVYIYIYIYQMLIFRAIVVMQTGLIIETRGSRKISQYNRISMCYGCTNTKGGGGGEEIEDDYSSSIE